MFEDLQAHLRVRLSLLQGDWVGARSSYDTEICRVLEFREYAERYWDAFWGGYYIEFKKGHIWIDLVRYAEVLLRANENACKKTLTLFFVPNRIRSAINEVVCVETEKLIAKMGLTESDAKALVDLNERVPRQLNAQASLTIQDARDLKCFSVP